MIDPRDALAALWRSLGGADEALERVGLTGCDPLVPSTFRLGTAAQTSIAATALAASELFIEAGGCEQNIAVDMRHALVEFQSERHLRVAGKACELWDPLAGAYRCGDGRWVRIHTNFAHHREAILKLLDCAPRRDAIAAELSKWQAARFEQIGSAQNAIVAMARSESEWDAHEQGKANALIPVVSIERIGDAPVRALAAGTRALSGVRVLDLTRIIAGPVAGRVLAAHGAEVLLVTSPHLPSVEPLVIDTGRGKRASAIDLNRVSGRSDLHALLAEADIFIQSYRPGGLAEKGYTPEALAAEHPGLIYASLSAYGHTGPWAGRKGFDSIVQTATGFNAEEARAAGDDAPRPLPCQALDHASGYLLAFGALMALRRRTRIGGSWHVRVSLARTGRWIRDLGRIDTGLRTDTPDEAELACYLETYDSAFGRLTAVRHAAVMSATPPGWTRPPVPLGTHSPVW